MTSKVFIGNLALSRIGARDKIESLSENSKAAREVNLWFRHSLEMALEYSNWSFARKRRSLALDEDVAPENEWLYRYEYPADCIKARYIENTLTVPSPHTIYYYDFQFAQPDAVPFDVEISPDGNRKTILSNMEEAVLIYTHYHERFDLMPVYFIQALSFVLASNLAFAITGKVGMGAALLEEAFRQLSICAGKDANEQVDNAPREADSIRARL